MSPLGESRNMNLSRTLLREFGRRARLSKPVPCVLRQAQVATVATVTRASKQAHGVDSKLLEASSEVVQGWQTILGQDGSRLQNAHAKILFRRVRDHLTHVLGWPQHLSSTPPHYAFHLATKARYPDKVIAVRTADHYNFVGIDAVIVCEKLDLKGEGIATASTGDHHCPEARVLAQNATSDFHRLCVEHKLDVVVCECKPDKTRGRPERFVQQICTPHNPFYYFGASKLPVTAAADEMAVVGLSWSKVGWEVHRWDSSARTHRRWLGLHFDGVKELLDVLQVAPPVYLRVDAPGAPGGPRGELAELRSALRQRFPGIFRVVKEVADAPGAGPGFQGRVQQLLDGRTEGDGVGGGASLPPLAADTWMDVDVDTGDRPMHLFQSTAYNLGINPPKAARASDVPSLSQHLLPGTQHGGELYDQAVHSKLNALLLQPPSAPVAADIREAIRFLWHSSDPSLKFETTRSFERISLLLHQEPGARERGGVNIFRELHRLLHCTRTALSYPEMAPFVDRVLSITSSPTGLGFSVDKELLRADCDDMCEAVEAIVQLRPPPYASQIAPQDAGLRNLDYLFRYYEHDRFDALYKRESLPDDVVHALERARSSLEASVARFLAGPIAAADSRMCLKWHPKDRMVSFFSLKFNAGKEGGGFLPFEGRSGSARGKKGSFLTRGVHEAQDAYLKAVRAAQAAARQRLDALSARIVEPRRRGDRSQRSQFASIVAAKEVNEFGKLLSGVAHKTFAMGWTIPELTAPGSGLRLEQVWPFWMPSPGSAGASTVTSDVDMRDEMFVLSGPNMSGKSTIMRTLVATALLANVGLPVPARAASVPQYKSFLFRNFIGDSPIEGRSGFALESKEMGIVLRLDESACLSGPPADCGGGLSAAAPPDGRSRGADQPRHFVCIDEFGKGTEDDCASAICAAALLHFDKGLFNGVFATHQHALFDPELRLFRDTAGGGARLRRTRLMRMVVDEAPPEGAFFRDVGQRAFRSQFTLAPGQDTRSLALQVAHEQGMCASVLRRAQQWQARLAAVSTSPEVVVPGAAAPAQQRAVAARREEAGVLDAQAVPPLSAGNGAPQSAASVASSNSPVPEQGVVDAADVRAPDVYTWDGVGGGESSGRAGETDGSEARDGRDGKSDVPAFIRSIGRRGVTRPASAAQQDAASSYAATDGGVREGLTAERVESRAESSAEARVETVSGRGSDGGCGQESQRVISPAAVSAAADSSASVEPSSPPEDVPDFIRRIGRLNQPLFSGVAPVRACAAAPLPSQLVSFDPATQERATTRSNGSHTSNGVVPPAGLQAAAVASPNGHGPATESAAAGHSDAEWSASYSSADDESNGGRQLSGAAPRESTAGWEVAAQARAFASHAEGADVFEAADDSRQHANGGPAGAELRALSAAREASAPGPSGAPEPRSWPLTWSSGGAEKWWDDDGPRLAAETSGDELSDGEPLADAAGKWAASWWPTGDVGAGFDGAWHASVDDAPSLAADADAERAEPPHDALASSSTRREGGGACVDAVAPAGGDAVTAPSSERVSATTLPDDAAATGQPAASLDASRRDASTAAPASSWTIDAAARVMHDTVARVLTTALQPPPPPPKLTVMDVQRGFRPPAAAQLCSTVYMLEVEFEGAATGGGTRAFYVGESDNFVSRFRSHVRTYDRPRAKPRSVLRSAAFVLLNQKGAAPLGKSLARKMESAVIQELDRLNCPLFSTQDGKHKSFGSATQP